MADNKSTTKVPSTPKAPGAPLPNETKPVVGPPEPKPEGKREKRPVQQIVWPTAEAAKTEAEKRTYGPRKAFTVTIGSTTVHCVAYDEKCAAYEAFVKAGGTIEELGGSSRGKKPPSPDAVLEAAKTYSPEQLAALKEQLAKL